MKPEKLSVVQTRQSNQALWLRNPNQRYDLEPEDDVFEALDKRQQGKVRVSVASLGNAVKILDMDSRWNGAIYYDLFVRKSFVHGIERTDEIEGEIGLWLSDVYSVSLPTIKVHEAVSIVAMRHQGHPVREYLNGLKWDGEARIELVPAVILGCEDTPLAREMFRRFMISAVARVMHPGEKVDTCLILVGEQGARKSTFLAELCGRKWFSDTPATPGSKDAMEQLSGVWIYEMAELSTTRRAENQAVKAFISAPVDTYRPPYGRCVVTYPRQCVIVGTTNDQEFLSDPTGSRRYWPLRVKMVDLDKMKEWRDQLWAEAVLWWKQGERWWLAADSEKALVEDSEQHQLSDVWADDVTSFCLGKTEVTTKEVLVQGLGLEIERCGRPEDMRVSSVMKSLGYSLERRYKGQGKRVRVWVKP
jgi:putative DNA primase/helicase